MGDFAPAAAVRARSAGGRLPNDKRAVAWAVGVINRGVEAAVRPAGTGTRRGARRAAVAPFQGGGNRDNAGDRLARGARVVRVAAGPARRGLGSAGADADV